MVRFRVLSWDRGKTRTENPVFRISLLLRIVQDRLHQFAQLLERLSSKSQVHNPASISINLFSVCASIHDFSKYFVLSFREVFCLV